MESIRRWWLRHRDRLSVGVITQIFIGKCLLALGIGALLASWLRPWAWWLIIFGLLIDGTAKWRWLKH